MPNTAISIGGVRKKCSKPYVGTPIQLVISQNDESWALYRVKHKKRGSCNSPNTVYHGFVLFLHSKDRLEKDSKQHSLYFYNRRDILNHSTLKILGVLSSALLSKSGLVLSLVHTLIGQLMLSALYDMMDNCIYERGDKKKDMSMQNRTFIGIDSSGQFMVMDLPISNLILEEKKGGRSY